MEGFSRDVIDYMNKHPDHVLVAMAGAVQICPYVAKKPDWLSDDAMEKAHAHIFVGRCSFCHKVFLELLRSQDSGHV